MPRFPESAMVLKFRPMFDRAWQRRLILGVLGNIVIILYFHGGPSTVFVNAAMILVGLSLLNELRISQGVYYLLTNDSLVLVAWPLRWRYSLMNIARVRQGRRGWAPSIDSKSFYKAWALSARDLAFSTDYLVIDFQDGRRTLISPARKNCFISALEERAPYVWFEGLDA